MEKQEELKNDAIQVNVHKKPNCTIELSVTAFQPVIKKARDKAFKEVRKEVNIPGFRKGKAPADLIEKKHPKAIQDRTQNTIADFAFEDAMKLVKIPTLNQNTRVNFHLDSLEEKEAKLTFTYETEPEIPDVDPKKFKLGEMKRQEIGKKELDEATKQMLLFYAKWSPVTDRPIEEGDYIIIDLVTEEEPPVQVFSNTRFEVNDQYMANWMKALVLGKKSGDVLEGVSEPDKDASEEEKKEYVSKRVKLTIKKVEQAELPKLDDEFAKKVGSENVDKLKEYLEKMLNQKSDEKLEREKKDQVNQFLLDEYPFELPLSLIESEKEHRKKQLEQDPKYQDTYKKLSKEEKEETERKLYTQAEEAVRLFYISRGIVRKEKIDISQNEVHQEAIKTLQMFGPVNIDPNKIPNEVFALALSKVILAKAQNFILEGGK